MVLGVQEEGGDMTCDVTASEFKRKAGTLRGEFGLWCSAEAPESLGSLGS